MSVSVLQNVGRASSREKLFNGQALKLSVDRNESAT